MRYSLRNIIIISIIILVAFFIVWPNNPGIHLGSLNIDFKTVLGLDLVGGVQALLEADVPEGQQIDNQSMQTVKQIVENRVNGLGVSEAVVQQAGDRRIVVELPGQQDPEQALQALKQTGLLEFVDFSGISQEEIFNLETSQATINTDTSTGDDTDQTDNSTVFHTVMTGARLKDAQVTTTETGQFKIAFELDDEGAQIFKEFTSQHIGDVLAIVLDKKIISAPRIDNQIPDGQGVITGNFSYEEANTLAVQLRYGALPIPLVVVESRTVGPTLGQDSLQKSLVAGLIGFTIVILFMAIYYRVPGLVADLAILIFALITFSVYRTIPVTLTLAGIAGFLLSTGSALDANILIFERIKEELRSGKTNQQALDQAWRRAWPSIRDSNIATLITCGILLYFGSQFGATIVQGFAVTLGLGIFVSVFTALFVTRVVLNLLITYLKPKNITAWFGL